MAARGRYTRIAELNIWRRPLYLHAYRPSALSCAGVFEENSPLDEYPQNTGDKSREQEGEELFPL